MTDDELRNWERDDVDIDDGLNCHFEEFGRWDWWEIKIEAERIYGLMFDIEKIENSSALDLFFSSVVQHAAESRLWPIAAALGVEPCDLKSTVDYYGYEEQDKLPPPVGAIRLMEMIEKIRDDRLECKADRLKKVLANSE